MSTQSFQLFLMIIGFFTFAYSQDEFNLEPHKSINEDLSGSKSYKINLVQPSSSYDNFIKIVLSSKSGINPMIIISKDDSTCKNNRLYSGIQSSDSTYYYFYKDQIFTRTGEGSFYICFSEIKDTTEYHINISDESEVILPIDAQTSYFVTQYNTQMTFHFIFIENIASNKLADHVTFWVKGQKVKNASIKSGSLNQKQFEYGYVFYGIFSSEENYELEVEGQIGDYITIGSITSNNGQMDYLKENGKEITVVKTSDLENICFRMKFEKEYATHITGKIYTRKAITYFKDEEGKIITETETSITNGIISEINILGNNPLGSISEGQYCLSDLDKSNTELIIFSIQMTTNKDISIVHPPMINGEIRRHVLFEGEIAAFYGLKQNETAKEVNLNLKALQGFPEMYFDECRSFHNCQYNNESLIDKKKLYPSNRMTVYSFYIDKESEEYKSYNPITSFQPIMIVYCAQGGKIEEYGESFFCEFETSYFTNEDEIYIYEGSTFSQYLLNDESDKYKIDFKNEPDMDKIYLDILVFSGDIDVRVNPQYEQRFNKYYISSKIYYSIHVSPFSTSVQFEVFAQKRSFYMVQYQLVKTNDASSFLNTIESGINFISSIRLGESENEKKYFDIMNYKAAFKVPYLITFYSQNAKFYSYRKLSNGTDQVISMIENTGQLIIEGNDPDYKGDIFKFGLEITNLVFDKNNRTKDYMIYIAGLEISNSIEEWNKRAISLPEGVPHRYLFTPKHPFIYYAYHISDYSKTLILNFLLLDKGNFDVNIIIGDESIKKENIYRDGIIYINNDEFLGKCEDFEVCTVIVSILMKGEDEINRQMEFSMYQIDDTPIYIEKNVVKKDIINGNKFKHYYFDIDSDEFGDITLDFKRGSGNIYASVVRRNGRPEENPDWRGRYKFPTTIGNTLKYSTYNKKIIISKESTQNCQEGCFVLISVKSNLFPDYDDGLTPYRISLTPRIIMATNEDIAAANPKVKININEFVIGDISLALSTDIRYDYYEVTLPYDSEYVYIDWQADSPSFLINVGKLRPELNNTESIHFKSSEIGDYVYQYPKSQILKKINSTSDTLKGLTLTIGIYSDIIDSIYSSPYAFKIYLPPKDQDIIHIRSDQKVQCYTFNKLSNGEYVCYFAVVFDEMDFGSNLIIYPKSQNGKELTIYGNLFDADAIERNNINKINEYLNELYNERNKQNKRYIYIKDIQKGKSYLFMTLLKERDVVEVLSSTYYIYENMILHPNPSSAQIFAINNKKIRFNFATTQDLLLNIVSLSEEGFFQWESKTGENNKYYLKGFEDRLSLTTFTQDADSNSSSLIVDASELQLKKDDNSGFIFYITYYPRNAQFSMDQLKIGRSTEFHYRTLYMPLNYYSPISDSNSYLVSINFYDYIIENNPTITYGNQLFNIWGTIISEEEALRARFVPSFKPKYDTNSIKGIFYPSYQNLLSRHN